MAATVFACACKIHSCFIRVPINNTKASITFAKWRPLTDLMNKRKAKWHIFLQGFRRSWVSVSRQKCYNAGQRASIAKLFRYLDVNQLDFEEAIARQQGTHFSSLCWRNSLYLLEHWPVYWGILEEFMKFLFYKSVARLHCLPLLPF